MATQILITSVTGGYNGGARINVTLDGTTVFSATAIGGYYNLDYDNKTGNFNTILGTVDILITPPVNQNGRLVITYSNSLELEYSIAPAGSNTSWGYNFSESYTLETVDPEPEPPEPEPPEDNEIALYVTGSEKNAIFKTLQNGIVLQGALRNESSVINPSILIQIDNPSQYNYVFIPAFNRYYFITDIVSIRTNIWRINCAVDVLMSYQEQLLNLDVIVNNDTSPDVEMYKSGEQWQTLVKTKTDIINFPSGLLDNGEYILITSGGVAS